MERGNVYISYHTKESKCNLKLYDIVSIVIPIIYYYWLLLYKNCTLTCTTFLYVLYYALWEFIDTINQKLIKNIKKHDEHNMSIYYTTIHNGQVLVLPSIYTNIYT